MVMTGLEKYWRAQPTRRVAAGGTEILFDVSTPVADQRARTLFTKEPSTIRWLDGMTGADVFYDVGANVGVYALYAASVVGAMTYAFEPDGRNFGILCRNIDLNGLSGKLLPFCVAVSNRTGPSFLYAQAGLGGESGHGLEASGKTAYQQGVMSIRLDDFAAAPKIQAPTMLKIDIDGLEPWVVEGLGDLVRTDRLRGLNIELNESDASHRATLNHLRDAGYQINEELGFIHPDGVSANIFLSRRQP
jgi:FkbM family methyltransferase